MVLELTEQVVVGVALVFEREATEADVVQVFEPLEVRDGHTTRVDVQILFKEYKKEAVIEQTKTRPLQSNLFTLQWVKPNKQVSRHE